VKIAIVNSLSPFVYGGAEFLADSLKSKLVEYGYEAQVIRFPFSWYPVDRIADSMLAARLTQLPNVDMMIGLKFPAYLIDAPRKKLWLLHQFRQAYDLAGTEYDMFLNTEHDRRIKNAVIAADNHYLKALEGSIYTISNLVGERLKKHNGISSQLLYHPLFDAHLYTCGSFGDYIFYPSRVNRSKRQHMAVEAMRHVKTGVKLVLAGKGDTPDDERNIFSLIEKYGLGNKVTYYNRFISQEEKAELYKNSLGVVYIPYDEDSYGYVTLEGIQSGKPLISFTDSGGTDVVINNGVTGYMTEPSPVALAEAMDKLFSDKKRAREMGQNGIELVQGLGISWDNVIRRLTE